MENENKENKNDNKNMSIADRFITAMFLPGDYPALLKLKAGKVISYIILLALLLSLVQYGIPVLAAIAGYRGVGNYITEQLPDFSLENGIFTLSEKYERDDDKTGIYILIDTDKEAFTVDDIDKDMLQVMLISRTNILMYNNITGVSGMVQEQKFSDFSNLKINNESVAGMAPMIYAGMFFAFLFVCFMTFAEYMISALFYALILYVLSRLMQGRVPFAAIYKIALFAQTLGALVSAVANFIGTPVLVMAGSTFAMIVTVLIMNRAYFKIAPPPRVS